jgi:hypothetical protein
MRLGKRGSSVWLRTYRLCVLAAAVVPHRFQEEGVEPKE